MLALNNKPVVFTHFINISLNGISLFRAQCQIAMVGSFKASIALLPTFQRSYTELL